MSTVTGHCLCGEVRFEITEPLTGARYCHCTHCQRRTGTGSSVQALVAPGALRVIAGEESVRGYTPPAGGMTKSFCATCGSALWSSDPATGEVFSVRLGVLDGDPGVRPQARQYLRSVAVWDTVPDDGLARFETSSVR